MKIVNHWLKAPGVKTIESPNRSGPFPSGPPDTAVIQHTAGASMESSLGGLSDPGSRASAHLLIGRDGSVVQLVPLNRIAWHAGRSSCRGRVGLNNDSIGIELDTAGRLTLVNKYDASWYGRCNEADEVGAGRHQYETASTFWHCHTEAQIEAVFNVCLLLRDSLNIQTIVRQDEVAAGMKIDPDPAFPIKQLLSGERAEFVGCTLNNSPRLMGVVDTDRLKLRSSQYATASQVAPALERATRIKALRTQNGWHQVSFKTKGRVNASFSKTSRGS